LKAILSAEQPQKNSGQCERRRREAVGSAAANIGKDAGKTAGEGVKKITSGLGGLFK
jgi:hypothetical protein